MDISSSLDLYCGGRGSGCNPEQARLHGKTCGRPRKEEKLPPFYVRTTAPKTLPGRQKRVIMDWFAARPHDHGPKLPKLGRRQVVKSLRPDRERGQYTRAVENVAMPEGHIASMYYASGEHGPGKRLLIDRVPARNRVYVFEFVPVAAGHLEMTAKIPLVHYESADDFMQYRYGLSVPKGKPKSVAESVRDIGVGAALTELFHRVVAMESQKKEKEKRRRAVAIGTGVGAIVEELARRGVKTIAKPKRPKIPKGVAIGTGVGAIVEELIRRGVKKTPKPARPRLPEGVAEGIGKAAGQVLQGILKRKKRRGPAPVIPFPEPKKPGKVIDFPLTGGLGI